MKRLLEIANEDFVKLVKFIKDRYGLNLEDRKILVESRLSNYVLDCGFDNFSDYLRLVYNDSTQREVANMINRLTTNHTYFMRETAHFQHMMGIFLPYAEKNVKDKTLSIWSAGCSYGNEPYNIAMCLDEYFGAQKKQWDLKILATDISYNALKSASNGVFSPAAIENVPDRWREKYFTHTQFGDYKVIDEIRSNVVFRYHNLMDDIVFKRKFDLIFCRNVMIYFNDEARAKLCKKFYDATEPGGYLYTGHAESIPADMPYKRISTAIYRKVVQV